MTGLFARMRRAVFGGDRALNSTVSSSLRGAANVFPGLGPPRTPFDEPPEEPVELDASEIPWELRDAPDPGPVDPAR